MLRGYAISRSKTSYSTKTIAAFAAAKFSTQVPAILTVTAHEQDNLERRSDTDGIRAGVRPELEALGALTQPIQMVVQLTVNPSDRCRLHTHTHTHTHIRYTQNCLYGMHQKAVSCGAFSTSAAPFSSAGGGDSFRLTLHLITLKEIRVPSGTWHSSSSGSVCHAAFPPTTFSLLTNSLSIIFQECASDFDLIRCERYCQRRTSARTSDSPSMLRGYQTLSLS
jgi:hypothetical protein